MAKSFFNLFRRRYSFLPTITSRLWRASSVFDRVSAPSLQLLHIRVRPFSNVHSQTHDKLFSIAALGGLSLLTASIACADDAAIPGSIRNDVKIDIQHGNDNGPKDWLSAKPSKTPVIDGPPFLTRYSVASALDKVLPCVVNIRRVVSRPAYRLLLSGNGSAVEMSCGSGFFISPDGLLVTNAHVVTSADGEDDSYSTLHVTLSNGESYLGKVVAFDAASDIALVKINVNHQTPVAELGDSDSVRPGEFVVAVGSPLTLSNSASFGIVSTIHRDLAAANGEPSQGMTYLQLDVAINQGSSGGPCVTLDGNVVGICSMKIAGGAEGIAFAIPIHYARHIVSDLRTYGYVRRPYVGLTLISVSPDLFEDIRRDTSYRPPRWLEDEMRQTNSAKSVGLMVHHVVKGGPGDTAGLKPGDVIIQVNDASTTTTSEFLAKLSFQVHTDCRLTVRRAASGRIDHITIRPEVLASRPGDND